MTNDKIKIILFLCALCFSFVNFVPEDIKQSSVQSNTQNSDSLIISGEKHFKNMSMLSNGGENAEAYFSFDGKKIIFQSTRDNFECDQIFTMNIDGSDVKLISSGKGRTTCSYFFPDNKHILYASTFMGGDNCPMKPDMSKGYTWALYNDYDIYISNTDGSDNKSLTSSNGYDAEATVSPKGDRIIFTSTRDGDIELYSMKLDGSDVKRLTNATGYDGGANYSYDGSMIVWRASRPETETEISDYNNLLAQGLVRPSKLELYVMNSDGTNIRQVTNNDKANFGPYFFPNDKKIIFCSNMDDPKGRNFDLYSINIDGTGLERITYNDTFDGFPMFSLDGSGKFIFCSNRFNAKQGETNVFVCDWVD